MRQREIPLKVLYNRSKEEQQKYGWAKPCSYSYWLNNCRPQWLYQLAKEIAGVGSMADAEIIPAIFGDGWFEAVQKVCRSEYWFWKVAHMWVSDQAANTERNPAIRAISEVRNHNTRTAVDRLAAVENRMTPQQICQFTSLGIILWDDDAENWVVNPLWFYDREL